MTAQLVFPDSNYDVQSKILADRKKQAQQLIADAATDKGNSGMAGNVFMVGNQWGNVAKSLGGNLQSVMADRDMSELAQQQRQAQSDWEAAKPDGTDQQATRQWLQQGQSGGLRTDLQRAFLDADEKAIEAGAQRAEDRVARADAAKANQDFLAEEHARDRQSRADLRAMPSVSIHTTNGGSGGKSPEDIDLDRQLKQARIDALNTPKPAKPVNLTAAQQKAVDDSDALLGYIDSAAQSVKDNPKAVGFKTIMPDMALSKLDPEGVATRAAVAGLSAEKVHQLSGAAVSPAEFARLRPYLPASGDTADAVAKKLANLRTEVERIRTSHLKGPTQADPNAGKAPQQSGKLTPAEQAELDQLRSKFGRK